MGYTRPPGPVSTMIMSMLGGLRNRSSFGYRLRIIFLLRGVPLARYRGGFQRSSNGREKERTLHEI